ncbi:MAG: nitroreductase [Ruminococcaceae bacterium]|nr:nitroreductase [Oscillospiraceae bacterium]
MTMREMIYKRKSCRSFTNAPVEEEIIEKIKAFSMKPLYPGIRVHWEIAERNQVKCICPWTTRQLITVYSEEKEGYLENVGFLFQQMELYLQTLGLGVCWLGMGRMNPKTTKPVEGMKFVIMLAFGHPKGEPLRRDVKEFKRKEMEKISDQPNPKLEAARLAPSAVNSQPWYFTHEGGAVRVYCNQIGTRLDTGIAMAHLYVENPDSFRFYKAESVQELPGYDYIGSVSL